MLLKTGLVSMKIIVIQKMKHKIEGKMKYKKVPWIAFYSNE